MADTDGIAWFERAVADEFLDLSDLLSTIVNVSTEFTAEIPEGPPADNFKVIFEEDTLNSQQVELNGTINNSVTTIAVATGHSARLRVGSVLQNTENIAADVTADSHLERLVVTVITSDADITVATRGALSSTAKLHTDEAILHIVSHIDQEFGGVPDPEPTDRAELYNLCAIFKASVRTSWIRKFIKSRTVPDEEQYQIVQRTIEMMELVDRAALNGMRGYSTISSNRYYSLGGVIPTIIAAAGDNIIATAEAIAPTVINALNVKVREAARQHELPNKLIARTNVIRYISRFGEDTIRRVASERRRGEYVNEFVTDLGNVLTLVADDNVPQGHVMLYNPVNMRKRSLIPLGLFQMPTAKTSDEALLMMVHTYEWRNADKLFALHTGITVPS